MANADEYERVLGKAEIRGVGSLTATEKEMLRRLVRETSSLGNRARRVLDGS